MAIRTQGTKLYFWDPDSAEVVQVACVTQMNFPGAPRERIETTCMEEDERSYVPGLATPADASFTINFDPSEPSHQRLYELYDQAVEDVQFAVGWSDGTADPTGDVTGMTFPSTRSFMEYLAAVVDVPYDFAVNAVVATAVALQVSGKGIPHWKTP